MQQTNNWIKNPTKKQLSVTVLLGVAGFILLLLAMTNFFTETPFRAKYLMIYFLLVANILTVYKVSKAYYKNNK
jgi:hypothetical protein